MKAFNVIIVFIFLFGFYVNLKAADLPCQDWTPYKDEKCFKIIEDTFKTFDEAEKACANLNDSATLPIVHSSEEQSFLTNFLFKTQKRLENFWIGAKFSSNSNKFGWIDNSELMFTNWGVQGPRNKTNYCIQMQSDEAVAGKWIDEPCEKKNAFLCQKQQSWSISRLQNVVLDSRKVLDEQKRQLDEANKRINELEIADKKIVQQTLNPIPIGFVYPQLPNEKPPTEIWSWMNWTDVSSTYAGVFFRVTGGDAAPIGQVQENNAPRVTQINEVQLPTGTSEVNLTKNAWTEPVWTGNTNSLNANEKFLYLKFFTSGGEVRPRNMAIRIWKRTS